MPRSASGHKRKLAADRFWDVVSVPQFMHIRRSFALTTLGLTVVMASLWALRPAEVPAPALAKAAAAPSNEVSITVAVPTSDLAASRAEAAASTATTLAARVDAWSRSGDPQQAMQAYDAISGCLLARRRAHAPDLTPDPPGQDSIALCSDLRSDQIQSRMGLLETAARAGIKDAAANFIQEGPTGNGLLADLSTTDRTPPTPDWLARRSDYVALALANCDTLLAAYLGSALRDPALRPAAAKYWLARMSCPGQPASITSPLADDVQGQGYLDALAINGWLP